MRNAYIASGLVVAAILACTASASAQTFTTLYQFCKARLPCRDGAGPLESPLVSDGAGIFYGTTQNYGAQNGGTLYRLAADDTVNWCLPSRKSPDRAAPWCATSTAISTAWRAMARSVRAEFQAASAQRHKDQMEFRTLYSFCSGGGNCVDGSTPVNPPMKAPLRAWLTTASCPLRLDGFRAAHRRKAPCSG